VIVHSTVAVIVLLLSETVDMYTLIIPLLVTFVPIRSVGYAGRNMFQYKLTYVLIFTHDVPNSRKDFSSPQRSDRLCSLVIRVPGYKSRDPCSIPGATWFSEKWWNGVHAASWVQLRSYLEATCSSFGLENRNYGRGESAALTTRHPSIRTSRHQLRWEAAVPRSV
jgi:hypothetical protein